MPESNLSPWSPEFETTIRGHLPPHSRDADLGPDTEFAELGVDSLALVQLLGAVEAQCDTVIPDQALADGSVSTPHSSYWR